jgi:hypothetical protein
MVRYVVVARMSRKRVSVRGLESLGRRQFEERRAVTEDAPDMRGDRSRNESGRLCRKRGDTHVGTIEETHDRDFGVRSDMHLDTLLDRHGADSLNDLINGTTGQKDNANHGD